MQFIQEMAKAIWMFMINNLESTISFENQQSTGNKHNLGKNLSNQFGSTLSLTHLAK